MGLKEIIKEIFWDEKKITSERYIAAKKMLIIISFLFFLNFYFVWAWLYLNIFNETLGFLYFSLLFSFLFYFYFFIKKAIINNTKTYFNVIIFIILFFIFIWFCLPVVLDWWIRWVIELVKLYLK